MTNALVYVLLGFTVSPEARVNVGSPSHFQCHNLQKAESSSAGNPRGRECYWDPVIIQPGCALSLGSLGSCWYSEIPGGIFVTMGISSLHHLWATVSIWGWPVHWKWDSTLSVTPKELKTIGNKRHNLLMFSELGCYSISYPSKTSSQSAFW